MEVGTFEVHYSPLTARTCSSLAVVGARRSYKISDLKLLFALSRNICAYPSCEQPLAQPEWSGVQCEIAHIYGLNPGSARYVEGFGGNSAENLILLCPNHHNLIDNLEPTRFSAEDILDWKHAHDAVVPVGWPPDETVIDHAVEKIVRSLRIVVLGENSPDPIRSDPQRISEMNRRAAEEAQERRQRIQEREKRDRQRLSPLPREAPMKRVRIADLGAELGMSAVQVLELCERSGVAAKTANSKIHEPYADLIRRRAGREGLIANESG